MIASIFSQETKIQDIDLYKQDYYPRQPTGDYEGKRINEYSLNSFKTTTLLFVPFESPCKTCASNKDIEYLRLEDVQRFFWDRFDEHLSDLNKIFNSYEGLKEIAKVDQLTDEKYKDKDKYRYIIFPYDAYTQDKYGEVAHPAMSNSRGAGYSSQKQSEQLGFAWAILDRKTEETYKFSYKGGTKLGLHNKISRLILDLNRYLKKGK